EGGEGDGGAAGSRCFGLAGFVLWSCKVDEVLLWWCDTAVVVLDLASPGCD
ncbi:hypothetical protein A2U01_0104272, partial [Trifolium medium]|nr:hypothetical protein [Trifolium medium]